MNVDDQSITVAVTISLEWKFWMLVNATEIEQNKKNQSCWLVSSSVGTYPWKKSKVQMRMPLSNFFMVSISSSVRSKSNSDKFWRRRAAFVLFGIAATPRLIIHFNRIWAGDLPNRDAIAFTSGISNRSGISRLSRVRQSQWTHQVNKNVNEMFIQQILFTYSFPVCLYKLAMPLEPSGEYAVTTILFALQKSTSSVCWKYTCNSICNEAGLIVALSKMRCTWRLLKFEMPMLLIRPAPTNSSSFCTQIHENVSIGIWIFVSLQFDSMSEIIWNSSYFPDGYVIGCRI